MTRNNIFSLEETEDYFLGFLCQSEDNNNKQNIDLYIINSRFDINKMTVCEKRGIIKGHINGSQKLVKRKSIAFFNTETAKYTKYTMINLFFQRMCIYLSSCMKMFIIFNFLFKYEINCSLYFLDNIYDICFLPNVKTNPTFINLSSIEKETKIQPFYSLNFITAVTLMCPSEEIESVIDLFYQIYDSFVRRSLDIHNTLNGITKQFNTENGGTICSYALTQCFGKMDYNTFVSCNKNDLSNDFRSNIKSILDKRYSENAKDLLQNAKTVYVKMCMLTKYRFHATESISKAKGINILSRNLPSFVKSKLQKVFLNCFHMETENCLPLSQSGATILLNNGERRYMSLEVFEIPPFQPILTHHKKFLHYTLVGDRWLCKQKIGFILKNKYFNKALSNHFTCPSITTYRAYSQIIYEVNKNSYLNEVINEFLPIYNLTLDIDINDAVFVNKYYNKRNYWQNKEQFYNALVKLLKCCLEKVLKLPNHDSDRFLMFESLHDSPQTNKLGIRFIVRLKGCAFKNRKIAAEFVKIINYYRYKFDYFNDIADSLLIDETIYNTFNHSLRLPFNCKPDGYRILCPVFITGEPKSKITAFFSYHNLLNHAIASNEEFTTYLYDLNFLQKISNLSSFQYIYKKIINAKQYGTPDNTCKEKKKNSSCKETKKNIKISFFTKKDKNKFCNVIENKVGRSRFAKVKHFFMSQPILRQSNRSFIWFKRLNFCSFKDHKRPTGNPCVYYIDVKFNKFSLIYTCTVNCRCFGSECREYKRVGTIIKNKSSKI